MKMRMTGTGRRLVGRVDGKLVTRGDLPTTDDLRWTRKRRATIVEAVLADVATAPEVRERYGLSRAEFTRWFVDYTDRRLER